MKPVRVMFRRTSGRLFSSFTSMAAIAAFIAASSASFFVALGRGGTSPVAALWAVAAVPWAQVLAVFATMRLVSEDRSSGNLDLLLTAPVREQSLVTGKFLGAWFFTCVAILFYLSVPIFLLPRFAPSFAPMPHMTDFIPALCTLFLQTALWAAVGIFASACCVQPAVAAVASLTVITALPWAVWRSVLAFNPAVRSVYPDHPFLSDAYDLSTGLFNLDTFSFYLGFAFVAIFASGKALAFSRMTGRGGRSLRFSTAAAVVLAFVFASLFCVCAHRADVSVVLPLEHSKNGEISARTRQLLSSIDGETRVTCFLSSRSPEFRRVRRLLRGLAKVASEQNGAKLVIDTVDPRWDLAAAARLVREGVTEGTLVFQRGRRRVSIPVNEANEPVCASSLLRLALPARRETVYWTRGHGEWRFDSHDVTYGMSDFARDLRRDGYDLKAIDISAAPSLPGDCALLVVAGAREAFSREELNRINGYLRHGGRMLVLSGGEANSGVGSLLVRWGLKILPFTAVSPRTVGGADIAVTDFSDHVITRPLAGTTLLFGASAPLESVPLENSADKDSVKFIPLVSTDSDAWGESDVSVLPWAYDSHTEPSGPLVLAAAVERGSASGANLAFRPTRIVVVGDAAFALNGALASRANANRDFLLNAFAWLAGLDASTASSTPGNMIVTGLERPGWIRLSVASCIFLPSSLFVLLALYRLRRRIKYAPDRKEKRS